MKLFHDQSRQVLHQLPVEGDTLGFAGLAGDVVLAGQLILELGREGRLDAATEDVDGVLGTVHQVIDALGHPVEVLAGREEAVEVEKFAAVVAQVLEEDTLGVAKVEEVERLRQGIEHYLEVVIVGQQQPEVVGDDQAAGLGFGE